MEVTVTNVNPVGVVVTCVVVVLPIVLFVLFKFVIKFQSDEYDANYWTTSKLGDGLGCRMLLKEEILRIEFFSESPLEFPYEAIEAFGREPAVLAGSNVFIVVGGKTHYFQADRSRQLVLELSRRIKAPQGDRPRA